MSRLARIWERGAGRSRAAERWDALRTSFGFLPGVAMLAGALAGLGLPALDRELVIDVPALSFVGQDSARSLLETIGMATVSVAGLSFSVTVVAFTLASSQLSPRVLRSFRSDRLSQLTLAVLLGTFVYCLVLLVRLGVSDRSAEPPNLSISVAVLAALAAFLLFAVFIAHIVSMLQPSSVVAAIHADAGDVLADRYPSGPGEPADEAAAVAAFAALDDPAGSEHVDSRGSGYLTFVDTAAIIAAASASRAVVIQSAAIGSWVLPGESLATIRWTDGAGGEAADRLAATVREAFRLGKQRTNVQDVGFPIRQLADIALKGLSPGVNDPTTAQNAIEQLATILVEFARQPRTSPVRVDEDGTPRFVAMPPDLDQLTRLGFGEVRICARGQAELSRRLVELLEHLRRIAGEEGCSVLEIDRQRDLIVAGLGADGPTVADFADAGLDAGS